MWKLALQAKCLGYTGISSPAKLTPSLTTSTATEIGRVFRVACAFVVGVLRVGAQRTCSARVHRRAAGGHALGGLAFFDPVHQAAQAVDAVGGRAAMSGPYWSDRTLAAQDESVDSTVLCHITAPEVPVQHRVRVYEAHGMAERVSIVQRQNAAIFAINFYRHEHQRPFSDGQLSDFESLAPALLSLAQKQIELTHPRLARRNTAEWVSQLQQFEPTLTPRELEVCARLLTGMTQEGIALDLGLGLPTVKTYRNRAFARLGIHFKSELFALFSG